MSSVRGKRPMELVALAASVLPPRSSLTLQNAIILVRLILTPVIFFATLPYFLFIGALRWFIFGGREEARRQAARLPDIVSERLQRMSQDALLPAASGVSTSTRSAPAKGPRGFSSSFVDSGNATLHLVTGGDFTSDKPILLMIHGFPESWATWQAQLVYFARLGFPVAAYDMRGYGLSTAPSEVSAYSSKLLVADALAVVRKLRSMAAGQGEHEVVMVAHDWGAIVGWQTAFLTASSRKDTGITKFVLASAPHPAEFTRYALFEDRFQLLRSWYMLWFQVPFGVVPFWIYSAPRRFTKQLAACDPQISLATFSDPATCTGMTHYYKQLIRDVIFNAQVKPVPIQVPVLLLWGGKDEALGGGLATGMDRARWTPHPHSRTVMLHDASHFIMHDKPKEVNEAILKFVQEA